ncbi:hypothetical protein ACF1AB_28290 [Streptomyces sp. NPDC014846]|uniref:hypothetical protein n=1 Tax=Streptomyces sp. NPDC014846 TaxID=3364922 RepID=UPI0036FA212D
MDDRPRDTPSAAQRFTSELGRLRTTAGRPRINTIAARAQCSQSTVCDALNGRRLPGEAICRRMVEALGGEWGLQWLELWRAARIELDTLKRRSAEAPVDALRPEMVRYPDPPSFYGAAADRIRRARREIRLTYVRLHPPNHWGAAEVTEYYSTVLQWARDHSGEGASVRRIIGVPERDGTPRPDYLRWLHEHHAEVRDVYAYEARVMPWTSSCTWHNTGLMDDSVTFLAFSGVGRQQLTGFSVEGADFLAYFADSFDQAWGALEPLDTYVARHCGQFPVPR